MIYVVVFDPIKILVGWAHQNDRQNLSFLKVSRKMTTNTRKMANSQLCHFRFRQVFSYVKIFQLFLLLNLALTSLHFRAYFAISNIWHDVVFEIQQQQANTLVSLITDPVCTFIIFKKKISACMSYSCFLTENPLYVYLFLEIYCLLYAYQSTFFC